MSATSYFELLPGVGYLVNFGELATGSETGVKQSDLDQAELDAKNDIDSALSMLYDVSDWAATPPKIIQTIANMLGSANAWTMRFNSDGIGPAGSPEGLREYAIRMIDDIAESRRVIIKQDGTLQKKLVATEVTEIDV